MSARRSWPALLLVLGCVAPAGPPAPRVAPIADAAGRPAVLVLVSVAGLTTEHLTAEDQMPGLAALASRGVVGEDVAPVAGAGVYPAHASLVTGVPPAAHGIAADHRLGERGVRLSAPSHASELRAPTLWQRVAEAGGAVASFDWPTTTGAEIATLLPDVAPVRAGERWTLLAAAAARPAWLGERLRGADSAADVPGPARDALLVDLACAALAQAPRLVLLRLRGPEPALGRHGPASAEARAAFAAADAQLGRLLSCSERAGLLPRAAFLVTGDQVFGSVHTALRPNVWLAEAGLITAQGRWKALALSQGATAFVYAEDARTALDARQRLEARARESGAFRVVGAEEMIARGADPDAWFGLAAQPGYVFENGRAGAAVAAAASRGSGGALEPAPGGGLAAFGRGVRRGVRVPRMSQLDVAPTLAALAGVPLDTATGRTVVGMLRLASEPAEDASDGR